MKTVLFKSISIILFSCIAEAKAQEKVVFYENITSDSFRIFFTGKNRFVEKPCAEFTRYTRLSTEGKYHGEFQDVDSANNLVGKGRYVSGKKDGFFELYHSNGKVQSKGHYVAGFPDGKWDFFHANGLPERTLMVTANDTLLIRYVTEKGDILVDSARGKFYGPIGSDKEYKWKGEIKNGKPEGKWTSSPFYQEVFKNGKFSVGYSNGTKAKHNQYSETKLDQFFQENYTDRLENARTQTCKDIADLARRIKEVDALYAGRTGLDTKTTTQMNKLKGDLRPKIDQLLENDFKTGNISDYVTGDNKLTIQFSTDKEGKAVDFSCITPWGCRMLYSISNSVKRHMEFSPNVKLMFFHLKLHYPGGSLYSYSFGFSRSRVM